MSTAQVLLGLGEIFFFSPRPDEPTPGFDTIQRDRSFTWVGQGRLNQKQAMQFTGIGDDTISVEGRIFPNMFGGLATLDNLAEAGEAGKPLMFSRFYVSMDPVQYEAELLGQFVITRLRRNDKLIGSSGISGVIDFTVELREYGADPQDTPEFLFGNML